MHSTWWMYFVICWIIILRSQSSVKARRQDNDTWD